ncbi:unnamed protein product [Rangifer tarandus platyrhynchus]|uniref:Uncharacterized protein n=2 Tax=Rangifer tarandus platyrhynchus TaxID=3082113 RepID=A0AC59Z0U0_RANTA|nr:unnamed protein product [Rangifer tarandus platyrhynchus]
MSDPFVTTWTVAHQSPLSMGFSRREYWNGLLFPSPGDPLHPGIKLESSALQADSDSLPLSQKESPINLPTRHISYKPDDAICGVSFFAALDLCYRAWAFSSCGAWGLLSSCGAQV